MIRRFLGVLAPWRFSGMSASAAANRRSFWPLGATRRAAGWLLRNYELLRRVPAFACACAAALDLSARTPGRQKSGGSSLVGYLLKREHGIFQRIFSLGVLASWRLQLRTR